MKKQNFGGWSLGALAITTFALVCAIVFTWAAPSPAEDSGRGPASVRKKKTTKRSKKTSKRARKAPNTAVPQAADPKIPSYTYDVQDQMSERAVADGHASASQFSTGTCTPDNEALGYMKYCNSLKTALHTGCAKDLSEQLRQAFIAKKVENAEGLCPGHLDRALETPEAFAEMMTNLFAATVSLESSWNPNSRGGPSRGYLQLGVGQVKNPKFAACCSGLKSESDLIHKGEDNLACGAYMGMYWVVNSTTDFTPEVAKYAEPHKGKMFLFKGQTKPGLREKDPPFGLTRPYGTFSDFQNGEGKRKRDRIIGKVKVYCDRKYGAPLEMSSLPDQHGPASR